jgi:dephospho-CoA kinase
MGKSTAADMLRHLNVPVFSADGYIHEALEKGGAGVNSVAAAFPGSMEKGAISRAKLGRQVFGDGAALKRLESILHPLVRAAEKQFIKRQNHRRMSVAAMEIPLLFETRADILCDAVVVLTAPRFIQERRVLARPGMDMARLTAIRARQMPEARKCLRADYVIQTGLGRGHTFLGLKAVVRELM